MVASQREDLFYTTAVTEAEMFFRACILTKGKRKKALKEAIEGMFCEDFRGRALASIASAPDILPTLRHTGKNWANRLSHFDARIAAIARSRKARLATCNRDDFADCRLTVIDPWDSKA